ncbi:YceI family protein [Christiangramia echinicola]|uniref:Polyisoprenoid-binding protein YceI n=1 Tax=Christiangramia echinicola TaxID=279359 RepID=A0A1H1PJV5_9FLAO|nr:YceI family protein [Christiangramia echinicola]SDS11350.1 Polyisoprenoid-binding protein YceI [Christiangramia echinicola]
MKNRILKGGLAAVIVLATVAFTNTKKEVDVEASTIAWTGEKVTGSHNGTIELKSGHLMMEDDKIVGGEFVMDMSTITVTDLSGENKGKLEGHLKSEDFFGIEKHPEAKLVITSAASKGNGKFGIVGDLTIKNETHPITFDLSVNGDSAKTHLTIDRSKYNVRYGSGSFFDNLGDKTIYDNFELDVNLKF